MVSAGDDFPVAGQRLPIGQILPIDLHRNRFGFARLEEHFAEVFQLANGAFDIAFRGDDVELNHFRTRGFTGVGHINFNRDRRAFFDR